MSVVVRTATRSDVPVIAALRRTLAEETDGPVDADGFEQALADWFEREHDQRVTWIAEVDGRPVGMLNMLVFTRMPRPRPAQAAPYAGQWGYVANVYVEQPHRDQGIGRTLLDAAIAHADAHGFARVVLSPSERSVPFYARAGFAPATSLMLRPGS